MQTRAILSAQIAVKKAGGHPVAKIMIPLVGHANELARTRALLEDEATAVEKRAGVSVDYQFGTMIEVPRGALTADEIAESLAVARSNVSVSIKELQSWDLVSVTHVLGDRRDYFQAKKDIWEVLAMIMDGRKKREIDPTVQTLRECVAEGKRDHETPEEVKERIATMLEFLEELSGWYDQIRGMPRPTLLKLMRMGTKVARVIG
jgi:DNA-binding transcriptional regulator GbsR (MarR family)